MHENADTLVIPATAGKLSFVTSSFPPMVFDHIEKLKRQYTDKYVVVDGSRPELARFRETTGLIKTINMSGRALVEFDHREDIGWYDIELDFLKVVDKPLPKPEKKEEKPAKTAPAAGAATKAAPASKPAVPPKPKAEVAATAPAALRSSARGRQEDEHRRYHRRGTREGRWRWGGRNSRQARGRKAIGETGS